MASPVKLRHSPNEEELIKEILQVADNHILESYGGNAFADS